MSYTPKNNFNLKMIKTTDEVPVYTPENNSNLMLGRTGIGEAGFKKDLWKTIAGTCEDVGYYFRWNPVFSSLQWSARDSYHPISVDGGVGDFSWSVVGAGFTVENATTSGRFNNAQVDGTVRTGDSAIVTVVDSCGNSVEGLLYACGFLMPFRYNLGVSADSRIFIGFGHDPVYDNAPTKDWWEYDIASENWITRKPFVGTARRSAIAASIGNKIYAGTGYLSGSGRYRDWWEYNIDTNIWTEKTGIISIGAPRRSSAVAVSAFTAGGIEKIYIGLGYYYTTSGQYPVDWLMYEHDSWTALTDFPGVGRSDAVAVALRDNGAKIYVGLGYTAAGVYKNDWWEYNPATDNWVQKNNFPGGIRTGAVAAALGSYIYAGTGYDAVAGFYRDWWRYNPANDTWLQLDDYRGRAEWNNKACAASEDAGKIFTGFGWTGEWYEMAT